MTNPWFQAPAPITRHVRAYCAPVNRAAATPTLFDPTQQGQFNLDAPPAPWISLGPIQDFARKASSKTMPVLSGIPAAPLGQVRETLQAQVSLQFLSWTKLTMALATGSQHMNLLAPAPAFVVQAGSTASSIMLAAPDTPNFTAGSLIALDADYTGQTGYVGASISGAYLRSPLTDVDYIRRVTFNVALVAQVTSTGLTLAEPLPAGAPAAGAKLQALTGFVDREGGCFYQEWSALFLMQGTQGERILFHYPRLQTMAGAEETAIDLCGKSAGNHARILLKAQFLALPVADPLDGERVLCYRSFLPAPHALV